MRIAIDAMGGDGGPDHLVAGAVMAARHHGVPVLLVGQRARLAGVLATLDVAGLDLVVADAPDVVEMHESPSQALRRKPGTSIRVALEAMVRGEAAAVFSAGHTGATVVAAHATLGMMPGADRPALAATVPALATPAVLLDVGANADCRPQHLVHFARMGAAWARVVLGVERPRIALLSIGEEATKGNELIRDAHQLLRTQEPRFLGNIEARELYTGAADVVVCDGFTGNVALKVSEGLAEAVGTMLRGELDDTALSRFGGWLSRGAFARFRRRLDYEEYGGVPLLGVRGLCLVGHGRSSAVAVTNAIVLAHRLATQGFIDRVADELLRHDAAPS